MRPLLTTSSLQQKFVLCGSDYAKLHAHMRPERIPASLNVGGTLRGTEEAWEAMVAGWVVAEQEAGGRVDLLSFFDTSATAAGRV